MKRLGPTLWDFQNQILKFWDKEKEVIYRGVQFDSIDVVDGNTMQRLWQVKGVMHVVQVEGSSVNTEDESVAKDLQILSDEFSLVFDIPKELPPSRAYNHKILLINPQQLVCAKPYRYPFHQKNKILKQVKKMLGRALSERAIVLLPLQ